MIFFLTSVPLLFDLFLYLFSHGIRVPRHRPKFMCIAVRQQNMQQKLGPLASTRPRPPPFPSLTSATPGRERPPRARTGRLGLPHGSTGSGLRRHPQPQSARPCARGRSTTAYARAPPASGGQKPPGISGRPPCLLVPRERETERDRERETERDRERETERERQSRVGISTLWPDSERA